MENNEQVTEESTVQKRATKILSTVVVISFVVFLQLLEMWLELIIWIIP